MKIEIDSFKKLLKQDSDYINLSSKQTSTSLWLRPFFFC